jgi:hypothetical protein
MEIGLTSHFSAEFYGNCRIGETGLYYDISGYRHPIPSLEVESEPDNGTADEATSQVLMAVEVGAGQLSQDLYRPSAK